MSQQRRPHEESADAVPHATASTTTTPTDRSKPEPKHKLEDVPNGSGTNRKASSQPNKRRKLVKVDISQLKVPAFPYFFYVDHSKDTDINYTALRKQSNLIPNFPLKLHAILFDPELASIIRWDSHGRSFKILRHQQLITQALPYFFDHNCLESFQRQLNSYGFRRFKQGPNNGSYYEENFLRYYPWMCTKMKRHKVGEKVKYGHEYEPDLAAISAQNPLPTSPNARVTRVLQVVLETIKKGPKTRLTVVWLDDEIPEEQPDNVVAVEAPLSTKDDTNLDTKPDAIQNSISVNIDAFQAPSVAQFTAALPPAAAPSGLLLDAKPAAVQNRTAVNHNAFQAPLVATFFAAALSSPAAPSGLLLDAKPAAVQNRTSVNTNAFQAPSVAQFAVALPSATAPSVLLLDAKPAAVQNRTSVNTNAFQAPSVAQFAAALPSAAAPSVLLLDAKPAAVQNRTLVNADAVLPPLVAQIAAALPPNASNQLGLALGTKPVAIQNAISVNGNALQAPSVTPFAAGTNPVAVQNCPNALNQLGLALGTNPATVQNRTLVNTDAFQAPSVTQIAAAHPPNALNQLGLALGTAPASVQNRTSVNPNAFQAPFPSAVAPFATTLTSHVPTTQQSTFPNMNALQALFAAAPLHAVSVSNQQDLNSLRYPHVNSGRENVNQPRCLRPCAASAQHIANMVNYLHSHNGQDYIKLVNNVITSTSDALSPQGNAQAEEVRAICIQNQVIMNVIQQALYQQSQYQANVMAAAANQNNANELAVAFHLNAMNNQGIGTAANPGLGSIFRNINQNASNPHNNGSDINFTAEQLELLLRLFQQRE